MCPNVSLQLWQILGTNPSEISRMRKSCHKSWIWHFRMLRRANKCGWLFLRGFWISQYMPCWWTIGPNFAGWQVATLPDKKSVPTRGEVGNLIILEVESLIGFVDVEILIAVMLTNVDEIDVCRSHLWHVLLMLVMIWTLT